MTKAKTARGILAAVVLSCLVAVAVAVPSAYALYYVWDDTHVEESSYGAVEIVCEVDARAVGDGVRSYQLFVPSTNRTVDAVLDEMMWSSEKQGALKAIHNYEHESLRMYLEEEGYTDYDVACYKAASQEPGTQTTNDTEPTGADTQLERYDRVVITVKG
ncbi:MAG: hypothetical protein LUD25_03780 [Coriobacteriaceae bacterium]|nr:hypothetical protein [Coriobacteriaceae bacterium]